MAAMGVSRNERAVPVFQNRRTEALEGWSD